MVDHAQALNDDVQNTFQNNCALVTYILSINRRIVTFDFFGPHKYSYLLTYLLT